MSESPARAQPRLSLCLATFKRGAFIGQTLDSILPQLTSEVELVIVDGASPDETPEVVAKYIALAPSIRYFHETVNSGVDQDYDKAVGYARGEYCWLMTDDDLLCPGAIERVLAALDGGPALVLVNAEVRNADFTRQLQPGIYEIADDREYEAGDTERLFRETLQGLTFIGSVIIQRDQWLRRDRESYYGSLFIHVGVIFQQPPVGQVKFIAAPQMVIRYGNAMWTARGFEIWMEKWPALVWSLPGFSDSAKLAVTPRQPWRNPKQLVLYRAIGGYTLAEYQRFWAAEPRGLLRGVARLIAISPATLLNLLFSAYLLAVNRRAKSGAYDLGRSVHGNWVSRAIADFLLGGKP